MANTATKNGAAKEIAERSPLAEMEPDNNPTSVYDAETLRTLGSFDEAIRIAQDAWGETISADEELGDGFELVKDKNDLAGLPMVILEWKFIKPKDTDPSQRTYVTVRAMVKQRNGQPWKVVFNDGSDPGIAAQLAEITKRSGMQRYGNLTVPSGIRRSDYKNEHGAGTSWYLR